MEMCEGKVLDRVGPVSETSTGFLLDKGGSKIRPGGENGGGHTGDASAQYEQVEILGWFHYPVTRLMM